MSLLSLLFALAAERSFSSDLWRFEHYYQLYTRFFQPDNVSSNASGTTLRYTIFLLFPVALVYGILFFVGDGFLHFIISTLILIVCFGCVTTRQHYKQFLHAASRDEQTTSALYHQQLLQNKNLPPMGFGQALIWLNYRYYIAIMLFFIIFGAVGVIFYRLVTTILEQQSGVAPVSRDKETKNDNQEEAEQVYYKEQSTIDIDSCFNLPSNSTGCKNYRRILFYLDWLPVRVTSFGYMFVGHFSKAFPTWLESFFDVKKPTHKILIDVAQQSEDIMVDKDDCTAEPCLLVRLSKRNILLLLATISSLTLFGVIA